MMSPTEFFGQEPNAYVTSAPTRGNIPKNDIFKLKLHKHRKSMVSAQQTVLSSRNCLKDFQMVMSFFSDDDDTDDDIKSISGTCSSRECILSIDIRHGWSRQIKLQTW